MNARTRVLSLLVLGLTALAVTLLWWQAGRTQSVLRKEVFDAAEQRSIHLADAMAGQVSGLLSLLDLQLVYLRNEWLRDHHGFDAPARAMLDVMPAGLVNHIAVADASGELVFSNMSVALGANVASLPHFRALREGADRLYVGTPTQARFTNQWIVVIARPIRRGDTFLGVVQLAVSTQYLASRLSALDLSGGDVVSLIAPDGQFLARSRDNDGAMTRRLPASRPFMVSPGDIHGSFHVSGELDGIPRTYGWRRLESVDLVVAVGLTDEGVLAPLVPALNRAQQLAAWLTLLMVVGGAGMILLLLRVAQGDAQAEAARAMRDRLFDSSQVPTVVLDPASGRILDCNQAAARAYGYEDRALIIGLGAAEVSPPVQIDGTSTPEAAALWIGRALSRGSSVFEWRHQRPDGSQWDAEVTLMRFELGGRTLLQFTLIDITARRQAEAALKASEARLKEAQRVAGVGSWELDMRTQRVTWSDEMFHLFELDAVLTEPSYDNFLARVHPDDRAFVNRTYRSLVEQRKPHDVVHRLLMPDGRIKHVRQAGFTEYDGSQPVRRVGTMQDVTAAHQAEEQLRRLNEDLEGRVSERTRELSLLNRELESFAYSVSHDLRTPLRSINGFAALLADDLGERLDAETRGHLDRIRQAANRMGQLIDAMLTLSRLNRGELRREQVDLSAMARAVAAALSADEPSRKVNWHVDEGMVVWADPDLLHAALENLLGNAWKYTRRCEQPQIRVERLPGNGNEDVFCVADNGAGFDMQFVSQLFEPFKRLHAVQDFEGTGVGLASVKRVVDRHGGWLRGEGEPGRGARFCIGLPRR